MGFNYHPSIFFYLKNVFLYSQTRKNQKPWHINYARNKIAITLIG